MVMKERDEELALFLEMRRLEKEKNSQFLLLNSSSDLDASLGTNGNGFPVKEAAASMPARKTAADKFLNSEKEKSEYDWLLTPPKTPLFPNLEKESQQTRISHNGISNACPTALKSRFDNNQEEPAPRNAFAAKNGTLITRQNSSSSNNRTFSDQRPSSSGGSRSARRPSTPTSRPTVPAAMKPSRSSTPASRATLPSTRPASYSARSSTPTSRATLPSTKPTASLARSLTHTSRATLPSTKPAASSARSSTPTSRATLSSTRPSVSSARSSTPTRTTARSSTPTARPSITTATTTSRSATPTRRATPSGEPSTAAPPGLSSVTNSGPAPSRGASPTVRSRPWNPFEMPGFSLETPPNLRTSLPERPTSASRGRPGAPSSRSSSIEPSSNGGPRRQSCSPSRSRASSGNSRGRRVDSNSCDSDSPETIGTKMVEIVVNMRKLAPRKQDYNLSNSHYGPGKLSSSMDSSGFGSNFSKKSLDMAMRHMDFRRSMSSNHRPLMTNVPASSIYSVRPGSSKSRSISVTDSPLATSSNCSEPSVNNDSFSYGREMDHL